MSQEFHISVDRFGDVLKERYINTDGKECVREVEYKPTLFIPTNKETGYRDIYDQPQLPKQFFNMKEASKYLKDAKDRGSNVNGMDDFTISYIADRYKHQNFDMGKIRIANLDIETPSVQFPDPIKSEHDIVSIVQYDNIKDSFTVFGTPSYKSWSKKQSRLSTELLDKVVYIKCGGEKELLIRFLQNWRENFPAIVTGWNIDSFDIPYIANRIEKILGKRALSSLSPWGCVKKRIFTNEYGSEQCDVTINGVASLDYIALYKKFTFVTRPNHKLDYIGEVEVGQKKIEFGAINYLEFYTGAFEADEDDDSESYHIQIGKMRSRTRFAMLSGEKGGADPDVIERILESDSVDMQDDFNSVIDDMNSHQLETVFAHLDNLVRTDCSINFIDYNIQDVNLVKRIDERLMLLHLACTLSYYAGVNYKTVMGTIGLWDAIIFNELKKDDVVVPMRKHHEKESLMGAYVKAPNIGFYKNIMSFDFTSLYPLAINQCNISPEMQREQYEYDMHLPDRIDAIVAGDITMPDDGYSHSANGMAYGREKKGVIPTVIDKVFQQRKDNKKSEFIHGQNAKQALAEIKARGLVV